jgi:hypothetical protein
MAYRSAAGQNGFRVSPGIHDLREHIIILARWFMTRINIQKSITLLAVITAFVALSYVFVNANEPSFNYAFPEGWTTETPKDAVAASTSPDNTVHIVIYEFARKNNLSALQIAQNQLKKIEYVKVLTPPTDMSTMKDRFGAESVAKLQLIRVRSDGAQISYRAFVFVKGTNFVVIEAMATNEASEEVFNQANKVIETFKFK